MGDGFPYKSKLHKSPQTLHEVSCKLKLQGTDFCVTIRTEMWLYPSVDIIDNLSFSLHNFIFPYTFSTKSYGSILYLEKFFFSRRSAAAVERLKIGARFGSH